MPTPREHEKEPTTELDSALFKLYKEAKNAARAWELETTRLRKVIEDRIGDTFAATVDGEKVITFRPGNSYATKSIERDYPELTQHFMRKEVVYSLDVSAFASAHPEIAEQYRVRSFREVNPDATT